MKKKNIVIVGGGTAGWLAALHFSHYIRHLFNITVIESSKIDILGAGEGTIPFVNETLAERYNITTQDLVKYAGATIKHGILFKNWNNDNKEYYHGFHVNKNLSYLDSLNIYNYPVLALDYLSKFKNILDINIAYHAAKSNSVLLELTNNINSLANPITHFNQYGSYALHFNARKLAVYLKKMSMLKGVEHIDAEVLDAILDERGYVKELKCLQDDFIFHREIDLLIDCTGFAKKFINKMPGNKWKSYKNLLPVDAAIPFFEDISSSEEIPAYTEATAMKYGWMWKIPVEGRYGCGYVFDSSLINLDQAKDEVEQYLGRSIKSPKTFKFEAGYHEYPWINNVVAIGTSSSFIEPLEATSIWQTYSAIISLFDHLDGFVFDNEKSRHHYNEETTAFSEEIFNFVLLHYVTKRTDTEFWKKFKDESNFPEKLKKVLSLARQDVYGPNFESSKAYFPNMSYFQIMDGLEILNRNNYYKVIEEFDLENSQAFINIRKDLLSNLRNTRLFSHKDFLDYLRTK